jgi:hypothetical protein
MSPIWTPYQKLIHHGSYIAMLPPQLKELWVKYLSDYHHNDAPVTKECPVNFFCFPFLSLQVYVFCFCLNLRGVARERRGIRQRRPPASSSSDGSCTHRSIRPSGGSSCFRRPGCLLRSCRGVYCSLVRNEYGV